MRRTGLRLLALVALSLGVAAPAAGAELRPLHAERGGKGAIVDDRGRQVILRGVNVNQLGDYHQVDPSIDTVIPLREEDFAQIAALGMDSVRLLVHWSALEPTPGAFDASYAAKVRSAVAMAAAHDIHVVIDMHQDAWGKFVDTPAGTSCPPPLSPAVGWDGAPKWATLTDGLSTCKVGLRELSPAVGQAWQSFWLDRDGIQQHLVDTWGRLVTALGPTPAIAGYDLLNEPSPGYAPGVTSATALATYYTRTLAAIRAAERALPGLSGPRIAFFEPGVEWSAAAAAAIPPPGFTDDPSIVFAPHLYAGSITADRTVGLSVLTPERGFAIAEAAASTYGTTVWSGEWGWFGDPAADEASLKTYARLEDAYRWGGAYWDWKQSCGDPHQFSAPGTKPYDVSPSLNRYACPGNVDLGIPATTRRILERPYPRAAPGRLTLIESNPTTRAVDVRGVAGSGSCEIDLWTPGEEEPAFVGTNVSDIAVRPSAGGWRVSGCARDSYELRSNGPAQRTAPAIAGGRCLSRRTVRLTPPRTPRGSRARSTTVQIGEGRVRREAGRPRRLTVSLRGLPRGRHRVKVVVRAVDGRRSVSVRSFRTCTRRS